MTKPPLRGLRPSDVRSLLDRSRTLNVVYDSPRVRVVETGVEVWTSGPETEGGRRLYVIRYVSLTVVGEWLLPSLNLFMGSRERGETPVEPRHETCQWVSSDTPDRLDVGTTPVWGLT